MKRNLLVLVAFLVEVSLTHAQTLPKKQNQANWQQKVDYTIEVKLDPERRMLSASEQFVYTNNSPETLTEIYLHLWPNAYSDNSSQLVKQQVENGNTKLWFAPDAERGWIKLSETTINNKLVQLSFGNDPDIARIQLPEPLLPGKSLVFKTQFQEQLPGKVFSRAGVENGIFCISQWYPKPAVYDANGWNPMPYLDQGEFYSEFGRFEVDIQLPADFVLAATGDLQNQEELNWWNAKSQNPDAPNPKAGGMKTLKFVQDSVHDFAWFASKEFNIGISDTLLANGKQVTTRIFAREKRKDKLESGMKSIRQAIRYYSDKVGDYPYNHATVVITPLESGGGMEYPTITNCQSIDRTTIIHEVGHNWFYGILGSQEREHPWMDESFNTYYENRLSTEIRKAQKTNQKGFSISSDDIDQTQLLYQIQARKNVDQAGDLHSTHFTDMNYGATVYAKNPLSIAYLQHYLGDDAFDNLMRGYYQKWKFKHPLPGDFKDYATAATSKDIRWFFDFALASEAKQDVVFKKSGKGILVKNKGELVGPIPVSLLLGDSLLETKWVNANMQVNWTDFNSFSLIPSANKKKAVLTLTRENAPLELYPQNNYFRHGAITAHAPFKLKLFGLMEKPNESRLYYLPIYAWNMYDKSMLGLAFYNTIFNERKTELAFTPLYSFERKTWNGYFNIHRNWYPSSGSRIQKISAGLNLARFGTQGLIEQDNAQTLYTESFYEKISPFVQINLKPGRARSEIVQEFGARYVLINEQQKSKGIFNAISSPLGVANFWYAYKRPYKLYPVSARFDFQQAITGSSFQRLALEIEQKILYKDGKKYAGIRFFGGMFLNPHDVDGNTLHGSRYERAAFRVGGTLGTHDYLYDQTMFAREARQNSIFQNQILHRDAALHGPDIGSTDKWILGMNLTLPFPAIPLPIGIFADANYAPLQNTNGITGTVSYQNELNHTAGFYISLYFDNFKIYLPLEAASSQALKDAWEINNQKGFFQKVSFVLNLNAMNPQKMAKNLKL
ncbi:MAG: M1 family metallopeptidase [Bacteroidetes bacterium]|nr:M1 family metallopeptidase [Bacteroidota bacterium]